MKFSDLAHSRKKDPRTNLKNPNYLWDFVSLNYDMCHLNVMNFSDRGTPDGYRYMHEYGTHSFRWENKEGEVFWVKIHIRTLSGIKNHTLQQAKELLKDPDYAQRDLVSHIDSGKTADFELNIQAVPEKDALNYRWNMLDPTKVVSQKDYPLIKVGKIILNRMPKNFFAETEQVAFSPGNFVPGMGPSTDRILQARLFSYPDTHRHRLGANFEMIPVNCPYRAKVANNIRDGPMNVTANSVNSSLI
jgi:catalase